MSRKFIDGLVSVFFRLQVSVLCSPRRIKQALVVGFDVFSVLFTVWFAFSLRLGSWGIPARNQWVVYLIAPLLMFSVFALSGLYRAIHRYSGFAMFMTLIKAVVIYGFLFFSILYLLDVPQVPHSVAVLQPMLFLLIAGGSRALVRFLYHGTRFLTERQTVSDRLLIYGAGSTGAEIAGAIRRNAHARFDIVGYLDDNPQLHGRTINGIRVFNPQYAAEIIEEKNIDSVLLAIPSASRSRRNEIVERFTHYPVHIQMLPAIEELAAGNVTVADIKEVEIEDLLGRDPLQPDHDRVDNSIVGRVVMVTGAGGSIGSELSRQLLAAGPSALLLVDHAEDNLYSIHSDLEQRRLRFGYRTRMVPLLADVADDDRIDELFRVFKPEIVYHAAAYKHVPLVEHNIAKGVQNNVFGTYCVAEAAFRHGVSKVVLISTDKAVRPTNVMGASKRLCEMILQALAAEPGHSTCFSMVRFGNVLGSSGSVVPLFRRQIHEGGPITLTHREITRYFMTVAEASQLVITAGMLAKGGEVFVLDMGDPVKIIDLAYRMVELSGLAVRDDEHPDGDIEIVVTGLRPGEKLYEELLIGNNPKPTVNPRIFKANEQFISWQELANKLEVLYQALSFNEAFEIKRLLSSIVSEYKPVTSIDDFIALEQTAKIS